MILLKRIRPSAVAMLTSAMVGLALSGCALFGTAPPADAAGKQLAMFEVPNIQNSDPTRTLQILRSLGVDILRVPVIWSAIAPNPTSRTRPSFDASNPAAYGGNWAPYDRLINDASAVGIAVDLMPTGGAPLWASASGAPSCSTVGGSAVCFQSVFQPSASEYGQFVHAVAARYGGVHFWEVWNEANWGPALAPQYYHSSVPVSAKIYRGLLDAGWNALKQTGHGQDTIVASSLSQDGSLHVGETGTSAPLIFIRTLYCVDSSYKQLFGAVAREAGCPTSSSAYHQFRNAHPGLLKASGVGVHPYPYGRPPTKLDYADPNGVEFAEIPHLTKALDRVQRVYGSHKRMQVYNTEYGYQIGFASAQNAAMYINWAEYLSWKNPRIATYDQYELRDAGWFPTGLVRSNGRLKPSFFAYRLPVWLPLTQTKRGRTLEVWGDARAAHFASADGHQPQYVSIQWSRAGTTQFKTVKTVRVTNPRGYFDVRVRFASSGAVRLAWQYPAGDRGLSDPLDPGTWIYSRATAISLL
jgi:hypothetical protein